MGIILLDRSVNAYMLGDPVYMWYAANMSPCVNVNIAAKQPPNM